MYPSICNSFLVIRTASAKIAVFTYRSPYFVSHGDAPATITQYVAWMERQFNACQTPCSRYLSIFNSFRVIRCLSQCVSPKIAIFTKFLFPLGTPLGQSRYMDGKRIRCLQIVLQHVSIYLQQFLSYSNRKCKKSPFSRTADHIFVSPGDAPATITQYVAWMERQFNACVTPPVCTYLSSIVSELYDA